MNLKVRQAITDLLELSASTSSHRWLALVLGGSREPVIHTTADRAEIRSYLQAADELIDKDSRDPIRIELQETVAVLRGESSKSSFLSARTLEAINLFNSRGNHQGLLIALSEASEKTDHTPRKMLTRIAQLAEQFLSSGAWEDQNQQALEYSFSINRAILNTLYDAVVMTDLRGRIQSVNPAMETMFGYPEKDLIGEPITKLMPREVAHHHPEYMTAYAEGKTTGRIMGNLRAVQGLRADGTRFTLQIAVTETTVGSERLLVAAMQTSPKAKKPGST